jgi:hypothetical protein
MGVISLKIYMEEFSPSYKGVIRMLANTTFFGVIRV